MGIPFAWLPNPRRRVWWKKSPLLDEDANTVSHVYWRSGALVDSKGVEWTMVGTVPQVTDSGVVPPGAGPFSAANHYRTTATNDPLDIGGNFTVAVVFSLPSPFAAHATLLATGARNALPGWAVWGQSGTSTINFETVNTVGANTSTAAAGIASTLHVFCGGRSGTAQGAKLDTGAWVTTASARTDVDATRSSRIGIQTNDGLPFATAGGYIIEILISTSPATEELATSIISAARARLDL